MGLFFEENNFLSSSWCCDLFGSMTFKIRRKFQLISRDASPHGLPTSCLQEPSPNDRTSRDFKDFELRNPSLFTFYQIWLNNHESSPLLKNAMILDSTAMHGHELQLLLMLLNIFTDGKRVKVKKIAISLVSSKVSYFFLVELWSTLRL